MSDRRAFVIVGAGMAGARAAETLRAEGFDGRVILLGAEGVRPYDRVPLSKQYLRSEPGYHRLFIHDEGYYASHEIELCLDTSAVSIDVASRRLMLESGHWLDYDRLLLATGARVRPLRVPGADLDGVHYLRQIADADRIRSALDAGGRVMVIGAGFIGSEVAASARLMGAEVTIVGSGHLPMERALGPEMAAFFRSVHADRGIDLRLGVPVQALRGASRVEEVVLTDGRVLPADVVVVGIGASPRVDLATDAGITVGNGVVTDEYLATDAPGVYAAGDVAAAWHPVLGRHLRLEHWASAHDQGPVAARNMLGEATAYEQVPFFFTDQYDVWMEYTGYGREEAELVLRGDPGAGEAAEFVAFWLRDARLVAAMNVNIKGVPDVVAGLVASGRRIDTSALADPDVDLADV